MKMITRVLRTITQIFLKRIMQILRRIMKTFYRIGVIWLLNRCQQRGCNPKNFLDNILEIS
jgi:hypothetical protein